MSTLALIGLGSNLGDRRAILDAAVAALAETPGVAVRAVSSYHETAPAGGPAGQGAFLNAAALLDTALDPFELLGVLRAIERRAGRTRTVRWGERSLDLDLLIYSGEFLDTPELMVPHPRMAVRRFVLAPLAEVAPTITDTITGRTIAQLLAALDRRPSYLALDGPADPSMVALFEGLVAELGAVGLRGVSDDLEARAPHLDAGLWPADRLGDRWLVSDFCIDLDDLRGAASRARGPAIREAIGRALRPTFAVVLGDGSWIARRPGLLPFPLIWPEADEPGAILAEILAACAASRTGRGITDPPVVGGAAAPL